jgi:hypothetical protein
MSLRSHARQRLSRFIASVFLSGVLLGVAACRSTFHEVPVYKDGPVRVSLRSSAKDGGGPPTRYEHPATLSSERLEEILAAVGVEEHSFFAWRGEGALLAGEDAAQLAPKLADGLRKARADQWVYFSVRNTPKRMTFGVVRFSDGSAFVKEGKLNLVFDNIAYVENVDTMPSRMDPRDAKASEDVRLTAKAPDVRGGPPALVPGDRWLGHERSNWLVFDLSPAAVPPPEPQPVAATPAVPPVMAPPPAPAAAPADPEERLRRLKDLRDKGLITADEYEKKRQEILKGL